MFDFVYEILCTLDLFVSPVDYSVIHSSSPRKPTMPPMDRLLTRLSGPRRVILVGSVLMLILMLHHVGSLLVLDPSRADPTLLETLFVNDEDEGFIMLPKRIIAVFGLESSGTTFVTNVLATAVGARQGLTDLHYQNGSIVIQHLSLPWGAAPLTRPRVVDFLPPPRCLLFAKSHNRTRIPELCETEAQLHDYVRLPQRFFVNVTTHVWYYQRLGVYITPVVVVRDSDMHLFGKVKHTNYNKTAALIEDDVGIGILQQALDELEKETVLVSYESLMSLKIPYVQRLYRTLGLSSNYTPAFVNGNAKYVKKGPPS